MMKKQLLLCAILIVTLTFKIQQKSTALISLTDPTDCIKAKCPSQYAECEKDPKCLPALQDCEKKCGTKTTCWQFCLPSKGSQAAIDVAKCAAANNCLQQQKVQVVSSTALALNDPTDCIKAKCPSQYAECEKDPKCLPALQDCEKKCGTKTTCWQFCLPSKGSQAAIDVAKCAAANNCLQQQKVQVVSSTALALQDPTDCIKAKCPSQYAECEKDPKCLPALQDCEKKCGTKTTCWQFCLPSKGSQAAIDVAKCAAANNCLQQQKVQVVSSTALALNDPTDCIKAKCPSQYAECEKDPKCLPALQDCEKKCGTKTTCWQFCLPSKGSQAAIDVAKCAAANNCLQQQKVQVVSSTALALQDPTDCIKAKCPSQYAECEKDPKCLPALQDCEKKCGTKTTCWQFCLPSKGSQAAIDVAKCAAANNCLQQQKVQVVSSTALALNDPTDCIKAKCPSQYAECEKDPKCLPALQDCEKKCGTKTTCWQFCLPSKGSQAAIDVAKCAAANNCLQKQIQAIGFQQCMNKSCQIDFSECISDKMCRNYLLECRIKDKIWQFNLQCLIQKSAFSPKVQRWLKCGGQHKCL